MVYCLSLSVSVLFVSVYYMLYVLCQCSGCHTSGAASVVHSMQTTTDLVPNYRRPPYMTGECMPSGTQGPRILCGPTNECRSYF